MSSGRMVVLGLALVLLAGPRSGAEEQPAPAPEPGPVSPPAAPPPPPKGEPLLPAGKDAEPPASPSGALLPAAEGKGRGFPVRGFLSSQYRARWTSGTSGTTDQDLYETLSLDAGEASRGVTGHFLGRFSADLDGQTGKRGYYTYDSIRDATGSDIVAQVYSAYLDFHKIAAASVFRLGRQSIYETPETSFFDGLRLETAEQGEYRMTFGAYGGAPVHFYSARTRGNVIAGAFAQGRPWDSGRLRLDWQRLDSALREGTGDDSNRLMGVGAWQAVGPLDVHMRYTRLDDADRDILWRGTYTRPDWDFRLQGSYYELLHPRKNVVIEMDAYNGVLQDYLPYYQGDWMASQGIGDHVNLDAGMTWRRLEREDRAGEFNREFDRYFFTPSLRDIGVKGSSVSVTEEVWSSPGRHIETQGLDVTCPIGDKSKASVGTDYSLYKYDYYTAREHDDVRTWYLKLEHKWKPDVKIKARYEIERDEEDQYQEFRLEVTCAF